MQVQKVTNTEWSKIKALYNLCSDLPHKGLDYSFDWGLWLYRIRLSYWHRASTVVACPPLKGRELGKLAGYDVDVILKNTVQLV